MIRRRWQKGIAVALKGVAILGLVAAMVWAVAQAIGTAREPEVQQASISAPASLDSAQLPYFVATICDLDTMVGIAELFTSEGWQVGMPYEQMGIGEGLPTQRDGDGQLVPCGFTALSPAQVRYLSQ